MDANRNVLPVEKVKELFEEQISETAQEKHKDILKKEFTGTPEKENEFEKLAQKSMEPPLQRMMIKKGMVIHFYGFAYKCTAARPNGKITLKFKGLWKGGTDGTETQNKKN